MDAKKLSAVISKLVKEEIQRQLPNLVNKYITEQVMQVYVKESLQNNSAPVIPQRGGSDVYKVNESNNKGQIAKKYASKMKDSFMENNPFKDLYEDVEPINPYENAPAPTRDTINENVSLEDLDVDFEKMRRLTAVAVKKPEPTELSTPNMKMKELEQRRKALEIKVNG